MDKDIIKKVGAMVLIDEKNASSLLNYMQFGIIDEEVSKNINTQYAWLAVVEFAGVIFTLTFSSQLFWPLEKKINQAIKMNWLEADERILMLEAVIGMISGLSVVPRPSENEKSGKTLVDSSTLAMLLRKLHVVGIYNLSTERELFEEDVKMYELAYSSEWAIQFPVDQNNNSGDIPVTKVTLNFSDNIWNTLVNWSNRNKKQVVSKSLLDVALLDIVILKPFQYIKLAELNGIRCGDAVNMKADYENKYWVKVGAVPYVLEFVLDKNARKSKGEKRLLTKIPKESTKEVCLSFGIQKSIPAKNWLKNSDKELIALVKSIETCMKSGDGGFYVDFHKASRGQVFQYFDRPLLQLRDHREVVKSA